MTLRFICGCEIGDLVTVDRELVEISDSVTYDEDGFLICLIHRQRRYGWRSIPSWRVANWSALEIEAFLVFEELPKVRGIQITTSGPDTRDNRDPEILGRGILASRNGDLFDTE